MERRRLSVRPPHWKSINRRVEQPEPLVALQLSQSQQLMSQRRKPLVRFETTDRAAIVNLMPASRRRRTTTTSKRRKTTRSSSKARVVKGRISLRVTGYPGLQKLAPSSLIPFLPLTKLRAAAGKVLRASGKHRTRRRTGRKKKRTTTRRRR